MQYDPYISETNALSYNLYCAKSVCIRSYSGLYFPAFDWIQTDTEYLSVISPNAEKYGPE